MHSFIYLITCTNQNLLKWKATFITHIEKEIQNIDAKISALEETEASLDVKGHQTWTRALYNHHTALIRQNSIFWAQRAKLH